MAIPAVRPSEEPNPACATCGREPQADERICALCGEWLIERSAWTSPPVKVEPVSMPRRSDEVTEEPAGELRDWLYLGVGALVAPVFAFVPIVSFMGWFLGSLAHEMGHAAVAWALGMPSVPAIRLDGHAAAVHGEQLWFVCLIMWGLLLSLPRFVEKRAVRWSLWGIFAVAYPLMAFTHMREIAHLLAGHGGELLLSGIFLWRAMTGGFTSSGGERVMYAAVGWYLWGANVFLTFGLLTSQAVRDRYATSGSFGLTNDYLRLVPTFGSLIPVAVLMTLAAVAVLPAVFVGWRAWVRYRTAS